MTTNNGWLGKPGVPLNPERDGWHWVKARSDNLKPTWREKFPAQWTAGNRHWIHGTYAPEYAAENWIYLGSCLPPDEAEGLRARVAELEGALITAQNMLSEMGISSAEKCQMAYDYLREANAALGGKDE